MFENHPVQLGHGGEIDLMNESCLTMTAGLQIRSRSTTRAN